MRDKFMDKKYVILTISEPLKRALACLFVLFLICNISGNKVISQDYFLNFYSASDSIELYSVTIRNLANESSVEINADDIVHIVSPDDLKILSLSSTDFTVFPNPASEEFYVNLRIPGNEDITAELYDISGKKVFSSKFYSPASFCKFKFQGLLSGIYFIVFRSGSFFYSEKIVGVGNSSSNISMEIVESIDISADNMLEKTKEMFVIPYNFGDVLLLNAISNVGNKTNKAIIIQDSGAILDGDNINVFFNFYDCKDFEQHEYVVVEIANKVWMAENLNSIMFSDGQSIKQVSSGNTWQQLTTVAYCDYDNDPGLSEDYGRLYNWYAVNYSGGICPQGWHVATDMEWLDLESYIGINNSVINTVGWRGNADACVLKESGTSHWLNDPGEYTNLSGFSALPAGIRDLTGTFYYQTKYGAWWTATESNDQNAWSRALRTDSCDIYREDGKKTLGLSVRCIYDGHADTTHHQVFLPTVETILISDVLMNSATSGGTITDDGGAEVTAMGIVWSTMMNPDINNNEGMTSEEVGAISFTSFMTGLFPNMTYYVRAYATNSEGTAYGNLLNFTTLEKFYTDGSGLIDIDGNEYHTVIIGGREYMSENLRTSRYNTGDSIYRITHLDDWLLPGVGAYCWMEDDSAANEELYGKLYNFIAVNNGNICPVGWHVPCDEEWMGLEVFLGMNEAIAHDSGWRGDNQGGMMKQTGTETWLIPNEGATNQSGFSALPGGYRGADGFFQDVGSSAYFWSMSTTRFMANAWLRALSNTETSVLRDTAEMYKGASIRCVRSIFTLPEVTTNEITDITISTATCGGTILFNGWDEISSKGVVWNRTGDTTIENYEGITVDGNGDDAFTSFLTGLEPSSVYYVKAYAVNSEGVAYGEERMFNTLTALFIPGPGVMDADGNEYKTMVLGSREWMAENLRVSNSLMGPMTNLASDVDWQNVAVEAYCWYDNDSATYDSIYGKLYNYYAVNGEGICPDGWMIPNDYEWLDLETVIGIEYTEADVIGWRGSDQGGKMKSPGTEFWNSPNAGATNEFGYSALPGGLRYPEGNFSDIGVTANFWMYDTESEEPYWPYSRHFKNDSVKIGRMINDPRYGFSVRCVKMQYFATVVTSPVREIENTEAISGGNVLLEGFYGVSSAGIVWSENPYPTIDEYLGMTFDSSGLGEYTSVMTGLVAGTVYYVRAYATNKEGTSYGNQFVFTAE